MLPLTLRTVFEFKREYWLFIQSLRLVMLRPLRQTAFTKASKYQPLLLIDQQRETRVPRLKRHVSTFELLLCNLRWLI